MFCLAILNTLIPTQVFYETQRTVLTWKSQKGRIQGSSMVKGKAAPIDTGKGVVPDLYPLSLGLNTFLLTRKE